ncbi:trophoblast glycoprotein [Aplochiton taeniatus]
MRVGSLSVSCKREENRERTQKLNLKQFLLIFAIVGACQACPEKCICSTQTVKCLNQNLLAVPQPLPANTKTLFVTGNNISRISVESFPTRMEQLTDLYLNGNQMESVDSMVFNNLPNLRLLNLSNNSIQSFNSKAFPDDNKLQELNLSRAILNRSVVGDVLAMLQHGTLIQLTRLDLSNNELVVLPEGVFTHLPNLATLSLQNGSIISLQNGTLNIPLLQDLDLRDNALRELNNSTLCDLSLKTDLWVHLAGNPWRCDCNIDDLVAWLRTSNQVTDAQNLTCADPVNLRRLPLVQVNLSQLECTYSGDMKGVLETSYVFLGIVLALIGVIFLLVLYLNRKGIKRWMYNIRDACRDHMEGYHYRYEINSDPRLANLSINSDV